MEARGALLENLLLFGRVLHGLGLEGSPAAMIDAASALAHVSIGRRDDLKSALTAVLVRRREDLALFAEAFDTFWRRPAQGETSLDLKALGEQRRFRRSQFRPQAAPGSETEGRARDEAQPALRLFRTWSAVEQLRHKDFAALTAAERAQVEALIAGLFIRVRERPMRRYRRGMGPSPDVRRSLRQALQTGGEVLSWARRARRRKPRPVVVLADISGSMEAYTRTVLLFVAALAAAGRQRTEAFAFGTRLTRITKPLYSPDPEAGLREIGRRVPDWSGGTRIGDVLEEFNRRWARRVLGGGPVVLVVSDGWDRGEPERLREQMDRLQRSCHRLLWLNPLKGGPEYAPLARGMAAALPYVDDFLPLQNLANVMELSRRLAGLPPTRPARRQSPPRRPRVI